MTTRTLRPVVRVLTGPGSAAAGLAAHLTGCGLDAEVTAAPVAADLLVVPAGASPGVEDGLLALAREGTRLLLIGPVHDAALLDAAGLLLDAPGPVHAVRVRPGPAGRGVAARLAGDLEVTDCWPRVDKATDDLEVLLTANTAFRDHPVATWRPSTGVGALTVGSRPETLADPAYLRVVHRLVRHLLGLVDGAPVRVGLLGYGAIGHEHNAAIQAVEGLELAAVCDRDPRRVDAARLLAPDVRAYDDGLALLADDTVDLVVVSTPPDSHAAWALRVVEAGKHAVVEKPFCITTEQADRQIAAAAEHGRYLGVYQNRRWDADYLTLKRAVRVGRVGEVFSAEFFVGGYGHPCNYWHSDERVSGGAVYDWGSHHIDQLLDLLPQEVEHVTGATHKRVWHDVTNADHTRVTLRFVDGTEAEFVHSDLAAAMKPKFYLLGTRGALVGDWRRTSVTARDAVGNLAEDVLAAAEAPAALRLMTPDGLGGVEETSLPVGRPPAQPFHRELADHLLSGAPMSVTPEGSRRNVAVMEAAVRSAREGGRPVRPEA